MAVSLIGIFICAYLTKYSDLFFILGILLLGAFFQSVYEIYKIKK